MLKKKNKKKIKVIRKRSPKRKMTKRMIPNKMTQRKKRRLRKKKKRLRKKKKRPRKKKRN